MLNYSELKLAVARIVQRDNETVPTGDTAFSTKIGDWVNFAQDNLANSYDYFPQLQGVFNFATVADQEDYFMPADFDKPLRIYDITNDNKLTMNTEVGYFDSNIANIIDVNTGQPQTARLYGTKGIKRALATAGSVISVVSSDAADTTQVVRIEGYIDSDDETLAFEDITLTGTSTATGSTTFYDIPRLSKSADTTGFVTVTDASANEIAVMTSIDRVMEYNVLKLGLIPDAAYNMRTLYKRRIRKLVDDNDYPFIDADNFYVSEAAGFAKQYDRDTEQATLHFNKAAEARNMLIINIQNGLGPDFQHKFATQFSQAHRVL